jgi:hypothetical protein
MFFIPTTTLFTSRQRTTPNRKSISNQKRLTKRRWKKYPQAFFCFKWLRQILLVMRNGRSPTLDSADDDTR